MFFVRSPPKTNMSPENQWLEDVFPIKIVPFKGKCEFSGVYLFGNVPGTLEALAISVPNARLAPASGHVPAGLGGYP